MARNKSKKKEKPTKVVSIGKIDLNSFPALLPENEEHGEELEEPNLRKTFEPKVFENLPPLLKDLCDILKEDSEKEVFFLGALGVVSGLLPNVVGLYKEETVEANLYCYLIGKYGIGKGGLKKARILGEAI